MIALLLPAVVGRFAASAGSSSGFLSILYGVTGFKCSSYCHCGPSPHRLLPKLLQWPPNWSLCFDPFPGVCSLHSSHCISAQNSLDYHFILRRKSQVCQEGFASSAAPTPVQTQVPPMHSTPVIVELVLRKAKHILPQDLCICCSRSLERPSSNTCMVCSLTSFNFLLKCHFVRELCSDHPL